MVLVLVVVLVVMGYEAQMQGSCGGGWSKRSRLLSAAPSHLSIEMVVDCDFLLIDHHQLIAASPRSLANRQDAYSQGRSQGDSRVSLPPLSEGQHRSAIELWNFTQDYPT